MFRLACCGLLFVLLGSGTSVAIAQAAQNDDTEDLTVEEILKREPEREDYVDDTRCISTQQIRDVEVIDDRHIAFQVRRDQYYLVQMQHRCPGMRRDKPVMYEPTAGRLCVNDSVRTLYEQGIGRYQPGMRCAIPNFQSVTREQLMLLKDALKAEKRREREEE